jgi:hypothetical protein
VIRAEIREVGPLPVNDGPSLTHFLLQWVIVPALVVWFVRRQLAAR